MFKQPLPRVPLRSTLGFMLSPAIAGWAVLHSQAIAPLAALADCLPFLLNLLTSHSLD
jgi:hypothetical protein